MNTLHGPIKRYLATALCAFALVAVPTLAAHAASGDGDLIVRAASTFYRDYLARIDKPGAEIDDLAAYLRQRPAIEPHFAGKVDKLIGDARRNDEPVPYDPVLMAQVKYGNPVISGSSAELIAHRVWGQDSTALCLLFNKKDGAWRMYDVIDMDDEESARDCGGMKAGKK